MGWGREEWAQSLGQMQPSQARPAPLLLAGAEATPALGESGSKHSEPHGPSRLLYHKRRRTAPSSLTPVV